MLNTTKPIITGNYLTRRAMFERYRENASDVTETQNNAMRRRIFIIGVVLMALCLAVAIARVVK